MKSTLDNILTETKRKFIKIKTIQATTFKNESKKNFLKLWQKILILLCLIFIAFMSTLFALLFKKNTHYNNSDALQVFEQSFKVNSKLNNFTQIIMNSTQNYYSLVDEIDLSYKIFTKTKFDIFTLEESKPTNDDKLFYLKKFKTVVIINSQCYDFLENSTNCALIKYLDLSSFKINNLRKNNTYDLDEIKNALIPLCILEHTNTNFILSVTCPETLSYNIKNDIINAFKSFKPESFKGKILDNSTKTDIEIKGNKIYINKLEKECDENLNNITCEINRDIITDLDGNLVSSKKISKISAEINGNNKFNKILNSTFELITNQNSDNSNIYKSNINYLLKLINSFMIKEEYMTSKTFNNIMDDILQNKTFIKQNIRRLNKNIGAFNEKDQINFFNESYYGINMELYLKNDIGLGIGESARTSSNLIIGSKSYKLAHFEAFTELNKTLNDIITITKASNNYVHSFYILVNDLLLNLKSKIISEISILNSKLIFKDLSSIFEMNADDFEVLPYEFVDESQNFNSKINDIITNQSSEINDTISIFKNNILSFVNKSHILVNDIYLNMKNITNTIFSENNKIKDVSNYYLNIKDNLNLEIINTSKNILDNYYINEKNNFVLPKINNTLWKFSNKSYEIIEVNQTNLDKIKQNLYTEKLSIKSANKEQVRNVIQNLNDSKTRINKIISNIEKNFKDNIDTEDNGYYISQEEINENKIIYDENYEKLINLTDILENDSLVDKKFDFIYNNFRNQFIEVLNYLDISKRENFPLKEDILNSGSINNIGNNIKNLENKILRDIKAGNNDYKNLIQNQIDYFNEKYRDKVIKLMNDIEKILTETILKKLAEEYDKLFENSINSLNNIIENNIKLANQYFNGIKVTSYRTRAFTNKANTYFSIFDQIKDFCQNHLRNDLTNLYMNITNMLREFESISIFNNYPNLLSFSQLHMKVLDVLKERFNKYISNDIFNQNYLPRLQNFFETGIKKINENRNAYQNIYNQIASRSYSDDGTNDIIVVHTQCVKCCKKKFIFCWKHGQCCYSFNEVRKISGTNNHLNLKSYNFSQYTTNFLSSFNKVYPSFYSSFNPYNSTLEDLYNSLINIKEETSSKKFNSLDDVNKKIQSITDEKLSSNILNYSYQYFRNEIINKMPSELNSIIDLWKNMFDKVNENITSALDEFKYPIHEIGIIGNIYYNLYNNSISTDYVNSIVEQRKNDLNYTIKYYYNFVISKVKEMNSYILSNLPKSNEKLIDDILNQRINEIKRALNNSVNILQESKAKYIEMDTQLSILNISDNDFFNINSIINLENNTFENEINDTLELIEKVEQNITLQSINEKMYVENLHFEKELNDIFDIIDKGTFIDLKNNIYKELIEKYLKIDVDELITNIKSDLKKSNEVLIENFSKEEEKYSSIFKNKIYDQLFTPEDLKNKINKLYSNGLNATDEKSKDDILKCLNEIIDKIKSHVTKEIQRLTDEMTSYTRNYTLIERTLNDYKNMITKIIYSEIILIPNEYYDKIIDKFYTNYIQKYLNEYLNYAKEIKGEKHEFLNMSIDLKNIINKNLLEQIDEYKNIAFNHIKSLHDAKIEELNKLFVFEAINKTIDDEFTDIYMNQLLPILEEYAKCDSEDMGCINYDLSNSIKVDISDFIIIKIREIEQILRKMKGKEYEIKNNWRIPDFSQFQKNEFYKINESFYDFFNEYESYEIDEFKNAVIESNKNNLKNIFISFIQNFGKDFFDNIFDYNNVQKVKSFYNNLKYSANQTLSYYMELIELYGNITIPEELKLNILSLNNLTSVIQEKNNKILNSLNSKLNLLFEENRNISVEKYINFIKSDIFLKSSFNNKIISIIYNVLTEKRSILDKEYSDFINIDIKNPMLEKFENSLNKESNDTIKTIEDNLQIIETKFKDVNTVKLSDIKNENQNKINNLIKSIKEYNTHGKNFKFSNEVTKFFDEYSLKYLLPQYEGLYLILFNLSKNYIVKNIEKNSFNYKKYYLTKDFIDKLNDISDLTAEYFSKINEHINDYGVDENKFLKKINKEIIEYEEGIKKEDTKHLKLDITLNELKNSSNSVNELIQNLSLFDTFNETINKYLSSMEMQYFNSLEKIQKYQFDNETNLFLIEKLNEFANLSANYYETADLKYNEVKENIKNHMHEINKLIEICVNITNMTISKKYINIKNNFKQVKEVINKQEPINIEKYVWEEEEESYQIETRIKKYFYDNEIIFDFQFENENKLKPIIIGKIFNRNKPQNLKIDIYTLLGSCTKAGTLITANFNNISLLIDFNFDNYNNLIKINTTIDFDEYEVSYNKYQINKNKYIKKQLGGLTFLSPFCSFEESEDIPNCYDNSDLSSKVIKAKKNFIKEAFTY